MRTALDADPARLDRDEQDFVKKVSEFGWHGTHVVGDGKHPGFGYTTGFWLKLNFPELIVFSLSQTVAHDTFWHVFRELSAGKRLPVGMPTSELFAGVQAVLLPVSGKQFRNHLGWSRWFYGGNVFDCLQVVYPDKAGAFPWSDHASDEFRKLQPDLTSGNWFGRRH